MKYRELGHTGLMASEIGMGCEGFAEDECRMAMKLFDLAEEKGINYFDLYASDPAMRRAVGEALKGRREKFQTAHEAELRAFQTARRVLKERYGITGAKGITIQEWKKERAQLTRERERLYEQYKPLDEELSRLLGVRHCAEIVMKGEQSRERHEPHEMIP